MNDSKHISKVLRRKGIDIQAVLQRARSSRKARTLKAAACNKKLRRHAFASRCYDTTKKIEFAGPQAAATYAHHVHGTFGWRLQRLRRQLGPVAGAHQRGRCLKTLLDVRAPLQDPGVRLQQLCMNQWLRTWIDYPHIRAGARRVWSGVVQHVRDLDINERSKYIHGPISAIITYLVNAGWGPESPSHWCQPDEFGLEPVDWIFPDSGIDQQH
eukprot:5885337-Pyramimonas_sp.AAC.1